MDYFELRGIDPAVYEQTDLPNWLKVRLDHLAKSASILDFGCGFGQNLRRIRERGFTRLTGADVNAQALAHCRSAGFEAIDVTDGADALVAHERFDLIVTTHVLEHLPKDAIVSTLRMLRGTLKPGGKLVAAVPNAQAFTGAYWAYEDFTHNTLFTSGSLLYVLKAAGFTDVQIIDRRATDGLAFPLRQVRALASKIYEARYRAWKKLLSSQTHVASVDVFTYEVKAVATV